MSLPSWRLRLLPSSTVDLLSTHTDSSLDLSNLSTAIDSNLVQLPLGRTTIEIQLHSMDRGDLPNKLSREAMLAQSLATLRGILREANLREANLREANLRMSSRDLNSRPPPSNRPSSLPSALSLLPAVLRMLPLSPSPQPHLSTPTPLKHLLSPSLCMSPITIGIAALRTSKSLQTMLP